VFPVKVLVGIELVTWMILWLLVVSYMCYKEALTDRIKDKLALKTIFFLGLYGYLLNFWVKGVFIVTILDIHRKFKEVA
jgi:hypothetical protein